MSAHAKPLIHGQPTDPRSLPLLPIVKGCSCGHQGEYNDYGDRLSCYRCKGNNVLDAPCPWSVDRPHRSCSLWDIMTYFSAGFFARLVGTPERMQKDLGSRVQRGEAISAATRQEMVALFKDIASSCEQAELHSSADGARRIAELVTLDYDDGALAAHYRDLSKRIEDDLERKVLFPISADCARRFRYPTEGWAEVVGRFGESVIDVEEMQRCFALERYAAAVFHSTHIVEVGLIALGGFMGVSDPLSGWTAVSGALKGIIQKKHGDRTPQEREHFAFFEQVQGTVEALKNSWRNKISHAHGRLILMRTDFTPEIAEEIILATRAFMRRLATELPE